MAHIMQLVNNAIFQFLGFHSIPYQNPKLYLKTYCGIAKIQKYI